MANDGNILDELFSLSWKIEELERKLENSLAIQEDLAANFLDDNSSMSASSNAMKKLDRRPVSVSSCSEPISSEDEQQIPCSRAANTEHFKPEKERTYLIIPVGSYKEKSSFSFPKETQTFIWSEMDGSTRKYISSNSLTNDDKEIFKCRDENKKESRKINAPNWSADQATPISQRTLTMDGKQRSVQGNGDESVLIPSEDCLHNSRESVCRSTDLFEEQKRIGGAFDIDYDDEQLKSATNTTNEIKDGAFLNADKYGLTINIATAKYSSERIVQNDIDTSRKTDMSYNLHLDHSEGFSVSFDQEVGQERTKDTPSQLKRSSVEVTLNRIGNHSSRSIHCDNGLTESKQNSIEFPWHTNSYGPTQEGNEPFYKMTYFDSESSEDDNANYNHDSANKRLRYKHTYEKNPGQFNANISRQPLLACSTPDSEKPKLDYPLLTNNGMFKNSLYSAETTDKGLQTENHGFELNEFGAENRRLIDMQINRVPKETTYDESNYLQSRVDGEKCVVQKRRDEGCKTGQITQNNIQNQNNNCETSQDVRCRLNDTKLSSFQLVATYVPRFGDHVYGIVGNSNNYEAINTNFKSFKRITYSGSAQGVHFHNEDILQGPDVLLREPHAKFSAQGLHSSEKQSFRENSEEKALCNDTESEFCPKTATSSLRDRKPLTSSQNHNLELDTLSANYHESELDLSESESLYSSPASLCSNDEIIHPPEPENANSLSYRYEQERERGIFAKSGESPKGANQKRNEALTFQGETGIRTPLHSFRLSFLPGFSRSSSPLKNPVNFIKALPIRVSSPTSSLNTSNLSLSSSVCGCQFQCECQTGITSAEDFREELKAISNSVFHDHQESMSSVKKTRKRYFLDEEQGDMVVFDGQNHFNENQAVPVLVKVILRIRKQFFGSKESRTLFCSENQQDLANNRRDSFIQQASQRPNAMRRERKISFSSSAMLLSAVADSSASELEQIIEKENIDVNQLSPNGRSLLHKAAAAGDVDSIYTLVQYGALLDLQDREGFPPIHSALIKAHFKCVVMLIECGTDIARYTKERLREFLEIRNMATGHFPVVLKTML